MISVKTFFRKNIRITLALFLALCMFGIGPMQELSRDGVRAATTESEGEKAGEAEGTDSADNTDGATAKSEAGEEDEYPEGTLFIRDIRYFHGEKGKKKAEEEGWILHDTNLNQGNDGDSLWLAYKTTTDVSESITSLKTMEMNGGYESTNYRKLLETASKGLGEMSAAIMAAAEEFRENEKKGYHAAKVSREMLNLFALSENGVKSGDSIDSSKLLGNYLLSGDYKSEDIQDLVMQTNSGILSTILGRLASGVFVPEEKFTDRLPEMAAKMSKMSSQAARSMDARCQADALELKDQLQAFSKKARDAQARTIAAGGAVKTSDGSKFSVDPDAEGTGSSKGQDVSMGDFENAVQNTDTKSGQGEQDMVTLAMLNTLNRYNFDETTKLGDKLIELGQLQFTTYSEVRQVYPLVMAMTPGQLSILRLSGVSVMTEGLLANDEVYSFLETKIGELKSKLQKNGYVAAPVWDHETKEFFDSDIAYTKKLIRTNAAGATFTDVTKTTTIGKIWNEFDNLSGVIGGAAGVIFSVAAYASGITYPTVMMAAGAKMVVEAWAVGATAAVVKGSLLTVAGFMGLVGIIILAIAFLVWAGKKIYNAIKEWDEYNYDEKDIPRLMLDADEMENGDMANVRYIQVIDPDNGRGDLNCREGKRWNALYYTRSDVAGDPICASDEHEFFHSVLGEVSETASGFEAVCNFNSPNAQALNAYAEDKDDGNHYLYYRTSLNGEITNTKKQKELKGKGQYLADIRLFSGATETETKAALTREGYKLYDTNISPKDDSGREYTYIGYKTTNKPTSAIRDIRVCLTYPGSGFQIGDFSYTPGQDQSERSQNGAYLCYTTNRDFGSPIRVENLFFIRDRSDAKPGWEPVNLTCGGPAFNWRDDDDTIEFSSKSYSDKRKQLKEKGMFLYFKPDEPYTDGEEYLSGLVIASGTSDLKDSGSVLSFFMDDLGVKSLARLGYDVGSTLYSGDFTEYDDVYGAKDMSEGRFDNYAILLGYTTTHNPYRALTDVKYYRSNYVESSLIPQLTVGGVGYSACENYQQILSRRRIAGHSGDFGRRFYAPSHAIISSKVDGTKYSDVHYAKLNMYDSENKKGKACDTRGLYTAGYRKDAKPLRVSDIAVKSSPGAPKGFHPVEEFLNAYDPSDKDLAFQDKNGNGDHAYFYIRGDGIKRRPKYVKNIVGTYFETPKEYEQDGEKKEFEKEQMDQYDKLAPEQCRMMALQLGAGEMVMENYTQNALRMNDAWGFDGIEQFYSYIGVIRTDKETEAMRGALKFKLGGDDIEKKGSSTVKVGGVRYQLSGVTIREWAREVFSIYTTTQTSAGAPVTEVTVSENPFEPGMDTVLGASTVDKGTGAKQEFASTGLSKWEPKFIHLKRSDSEKSYFSRIVVNYGGDEKDAQTKLLTSGCNRCIPLNLNKYNDGFVVMIGARTCGASSPDIAIRDIVCTVGKEAEESFMENGFEYQLAGKVSLNQAASHGKKIYVYYTHGVKLVGSDEYENLIGSETTTETTPTSTEDDLGDWLDDEDEDEDKIVYMDRSPITRLAASMGDFLPDSANGVEWEKILDTKGKRVNTNDGIISRDEDQNVIDNRIYLYDAREDGSVKSGAKVTEVDGKYMMLIGLMKLVS